MRRRRDEKREKREMERDIYVVSLILMFKVEVDSVFLFFCFSILSFVRSCC